MSGRADIATGGWLVHAELARTLWDTGMLASDIARRVGHGATKNSIVGFAHRHGWPPRPSPIAVNGIRAVAAVPRQPYKPKSERKVAKAPAKPKPPAPPRAPQPRPTPVPEPGHRGCQWLESERPHRFECTNPPLPGTAWCAIHHARVYVPRRHTMGLAA